MSKFIGSKDNTGMCKDEVSIEQQKNKITELEKLVEQLNSRIEYQENMLNTLSEEFADQLEVINKYDFSTSEITTTLIKMKNKFEVLEDRAFYTDSLYFEIVNDLVQIENKIVSLTTSYKEMIQLKTSGSINLTIKNLGYKPNRKLKYGVKQFINWYKSYYKK